jgi:hypothetical protein
MCCLKWRADTEDVLAERSVEENDDTHRISSYNGIRAVERDNEINGQREIAIS